MHEVIDCSPELESINSSGRKKFWQMFVITCEGEVYTYTVSWQELAEGLSKKNRSEMTKVEGKNIGRANETTPEDQAKSEMRSAVNKKTDEGYHEAGATSSALPLPMLAYKYPKDAKKFVFPCYCQPKFDGFRCVSDGNKAWSRKGKLYPDEVIEHLKFDTNGLILDGELMLPPECPFEQVKSATAKFNPELTPLLSYYVFDTIPNEQVPFDASFGLRRAILEETFKQAESSGVLPENVHLVKTVMCTDADHAEARLMKCLEIGYEGVMLRSCNGKYAIGQRSRDLLKFKFMESADGSVLGFIDSEFEIVDCLDGRGREAECIIYVCKTPDGKTFNVRPEGTIEDRKQLWYNYCTGEFDPKGKELTVRYQNLSKYNVPRFPVGRAIRDYE